MSETNQEAFARGLMTDPTPNVIAILDAAVKRQDDLREAETRRVNGIFDTDKTMVASAATVQREQANTMALQVTNSAEALRNQVAAAAIATAAAQKSDLEPIQKDIAELRKAMYEAQGQKTQIVESRDIQADQRPIMEALAALTATASRNEGKEVQIVETKADTNAFQTLILSVIGTFFVAIAIGVSVAALILK